MRGRINLMDLFDAPFNLVHELYYYTFTVREAREEDRKKEEQEKKKKEEEEKARQQSRKKLPTSFDRPLSPAALAKASKAMKAQADDEKKSEGNIFKNSEPSLPSNIDTGELADLLEEGL